VSFALPQVPPAPPSNVRDPEVSRYLDSVYRYLKDVELTLRTWQSFLQGLGETVEIEGIRDSNTALAALLTALADKKMLTDSTTAS